MSDTNGNELQRFSASWQRAIDEKDWNGAILVGISAFLYFTSKNEERNRDAAVGLIVAAFEIQNPIHESGAGKNCSFCHTSDATLNMGAGASACICENCVRMFSGLFAE
jgi:hypothetical protein